MNNFDDLLIENKLKKSIQFADFKTPTPIQSKSIPVSLTGRDILGTAQTGTGKTFMPEYLAFWKENLLN